MDVDMLRERAEKLNNMIDNINKIHENLGDLIEDLRHEEVLLVVQCAQELGAFGEFVWNVSIKGDVITLSAEREKFSYLDQILRADNLSTYSINETGTVVLNFVDDSVHLEFYKGESPIEWKSRLGLRFNEVQIQTEIETIRENISKYEEFLKPPEVSIE